MTAEGRARGGVEEVQARLGGVAGVDTQRHRVLPEHRDVGIATCDSPESAAFRQDIADWAKLCDRLWVWDYVTCFSNYLLPFPDLRVLDDNGNGTGGSKYPIDLLKDAGVDMTTDEPLDLTMRRMNQVMDETEKLLAK